MDIWEVNLDVIVYILYVCFVNEQICCEGVDCGVGSDRYNFICDKDGCDFNLYCFGNREFYGFGKMVDMIRFFIIVIQFVIDDGIDSGNLKSIYWYYVQDGNVIFNFVIEVVGVDQMNFISEGFCEQQKSVFGDNNYFGQLGGMRVMGESLKKMVLVLSIWDDQYVLFFFF